MCKALAFCCKFSHISVSLARRWWKDIHRKMWIAIRYCRFENWQHSGNRLNCATASELHNCSFCGTFGDTIRISASVLFQVTVSWRIGNNDAFSILILTVDKRRREPPSQMPAYRKATNVKPCHSPTTFGGWQDYKFVILASLLEKASVRGIRRCDQEKAKSE